ncbi:MAG: GtrA family protein, partial [Pseudomonadota bacterium]
IPLLGYESLRLRLLNGWRNRALSLKAISFAMVGIVNTLVDYSVFLLARAALSRSLTAVALFSALAQSCRCASSTILLLIAANMTSWIVAVTGSYMLNSSITFAAESGRQLRWRSYFTFLASGIAGWLANTATLVFAAQMLLLPIWLAKAAAILASFVVNFSLSHFVVFRVRGRPAIDRRKDI